MGILYHSPVDLRRVFLLSKFDIVAAVPKKRGTDHVRGKCTQESTANDKTDEEVTLAQYLGI